MYRYSKQCFTCSGQKHRTPKERREYIRAKNRRAYWRHRADRLERNRLYYETHREELKANQHKYNQEHSAEINARLRARRQANPEHFKAINNRYESKRRTSERFKAYQRNYRLTNRDRINAQRVAYYRTPHGKQVFMESRRRHHDSRFLRENKYYLLWIINAPCQECGSYHRREVDHIIPRSQGGSDKLSNLRILCFTHHRKAGSGRHSTWRAGS